MLAVRVAECYWALFAAAYGPKVVAEGEGCGEGFWGSLWLLWGWFWGTLGVLRGWVIEDGFGAVLCFHQLSFWRVRAKGCKVCVFWCLLRGGS